MRSHAVALTLALGAACGDGGDDGDDGERAYLPRQERPMPARFGRATHEVSVCGDATIAETRTTELQARTGMSTAYLNSCAGCHDEPNGGARPLQPGTSFAAFREVVRGGRGGMPAFSAALYTDAELAADHAWVAAGAAPVWPEGTFREVPLATAGPISESEHREAMTIGMRAWRRPGATGACAACHGPDGIDLAGIGYPRAAILRRALGQGRTTAEAMSIVQMIEAQRRWHGIATPCSPALFRPLQPSGLVPPAQGTPGDDGALAERLEAHGVSLGEAPVDVAGARRIVDAVLGLDAGAVAIAVPLARWSSDAAHGPGDRTTSEWVSEVALEPRDARADEAWTALENAYLEEPTDARLWALYDGLAALGSDRFAPPGFGERLSREKLRAAFVFQHFMRTGALPAVAVGVGFRRFPVWETAQVALALSRGCAEAEPVTARPLLTCWSYPDALYAKMGRDRAALLADVRALAAPWFIAGLLAEPSLQLTENGDARMRALHEALDETGRWLPLHHLHFGLLRLVRATEGLDEKLPVGRGLERAAVNGCWARGGVVLDEWAGPALDAIERALSRVPEGAQTHAARVAAWTDAANRAVLLLIEEALARPAPRCDEPGAGVATAVRGIAGFRHGSMATNAVAKRILESRGSTP